MAIPKKTATQFAEYSSLAMLLPASIVAGYLIGHWLDGVFGTTWLRLLFLLLGIAAGFVSLIRRIMRDMRDDDA